MSLIPSSLKWLYVDFNSYFASVEQQLQPHLRGKPIAVVPVDTATTCAIAASYEAKAFGIRTGTPIYEARQLCPNLVCVLARHELYVEYHHRAIEEINRHVPVAKICSIDEMACHLLSNEAPEPVARALAMRIKHGLAQALGPYVRCSIGIAPNMYLAKVATDLQKPDGLTVLQMEDIPDSLLVLSPRDLPGIGRKMEQRLHRANIVSMANLLALDRRQMTALWHSKLGERLWYELRGVEVPNVPTQRSSIGHSHVLAPALRPPEHAVEVARRLLLKACSRLRRMGYCAGTLYFSAQIENGPRLEAERRTLSAQDNATFLALLHTIWQDMILPQGAIRIKKLAVSLHRFQPENAIQGDLFTTLQDVTERLAVLDTGKSLRLSYAMDRLNNRFGRDTILVGLLPSKGRAFSGAKIAFNRIPEKQEFLE